MLLHQKVAILIFLPGFFKLRITFFMWIIQNDQVPRLHLQKKTPFLLLTTIFCISWGHVLKKTCFKSGYLHKPRCLKPWKTISVEFYINKNWKRKKEKWESASSLFENGRILNLIFNSFGLKPSLSIFDCDRHVTIKLVTKSIFFYKSLVENIFNTTKRFYSPKN